MKAKYLYLVSLLSVFLFSSCTVENYYDDPNYLGPNGISLPQLMEGYDLWYIDYNATTGSGDVPFLSRAFTVSFTNGTLYANNNLAGFGVTGNGLGIPVGYYNYASNSIVVNHNVYGTYQLAVTQVSANEIRVYNAYENVSYTLLGYQRNQFDYDFVFFDNLTYFLQEYTVWEKVFTSNAGAVNPFDQENYLRFLPNNQMFQSSIDVDIGNVANIIWDFQGNYNVQNLNNNNTVKRLNMVYTNGEVEQFNLSVLNDSRIRLFHLASGTTYDFQGVGFIQYLRTQAKRIKE